MSFTDNTRPVYRVLNPNGFFGPNDHLFKEDEEIVYDGTPNEELEPLNEAAKQKMVAFIENLDSEARKTAEKLGRPFVERPRGIDGALDLATEIQRSNMGIQGTKKGDVGIELATPSVIAETGGINPKRGRGRPRKDASAVA